MAQDIKLQALLELERRGALNDRASQMLAAYRAQGVTNTTPLGASGQPSPDQGNRLELKKSRDDARKAIDLMDRIQPQVDRVRAIYGKNFKGTGPLQSLGEYVPGFMSQKNGQLDAAAAQLRAFARPATRTPGEGGMSDFETRLAMQAMPDRWYADAANEEALSGLQTFLDQSRSDYSKRLGLPTPPPRRKGPPGRPEITLDANGRIVR
jgi:hypothetical protein